MKIEDLVVAFENEIDLPIDLNKVKDWIVKNTAQDEIEFIEVDMDTEIIRGYLYRFTYQKTVYGESVLASNIYYSRNQSEEWINLVCCKEMVHLADGVNTSPSISLGRSPIVWGVA